METRYKYINFTFDQDLSVWNCCANESGEQIGVIEFYKPFECHVFSTSGILFASTSECLRDIARFMDNII